MTSTHRPLDSLRTLVEAGITKLIAYSWRSLGWSISKHHLSFITHNLTLKLYATKYLISFSIICLLSCLTAGCMMLMGTAGWIFPRWRKLSNQSTGWSAPRPCRLRGEPGRCSGRWTGGSGEVSELVISQQSSVNSQLTKTNSFKSISTFIIIMYIHLAFHKSCLYLIIYFYTYIVSVVTFYIVAPKSISPFIVIKFIFIWLAANLVYT